MKYAVEMGSDATMYVPSFIQTGSGIQTFIKWDTQTHREHGDFISLILFFRIREIVKGQKSQSYHLQRRYRQICWTQKLDSFTV
jgi:hypothetical protein